MAEITFVRSTLWVRKKQDTIVFSGTSPNVYRLSEFFYCLLLSLTVKKIWKLVNFWWSYGQLFSVLFFSESQCSSAERRIATAHTYTSHDFIYQADTDHFYIFKTLSYSFKFDPRWNYHKIAFSLWGGWTPTNTYFFGPTPGYSGISVESSPMCSTDRRTDRQTDKQRPRNVCSNSSQCQRCCLISP